MDYVIIVAGGKGLRMGCDIPKQFLKICGEPVLMRTVRRFREYSDSLKIILVLPETQQDYWHRLCKECEFDVEYTLVNGGDTRFHSVSNGLAAIPPEAEGIVSVHDGVRPFVSLDVIRRCYDAAKSQKAVIPVMPVIETLRHVSDDNTSENVQRNDYRLVQTPQTFDIRTFKKAYSQPYRECFTDDASVVESAGNKVYMVEGNRENIKITTPFDMKIAEVVAKNE